jgi:signal transduction histidine kinase
VIPPRSQAANPFAISPQRSMARRVPWPLVVLLLSIGLTAVAAFDAQRAVRTQRRVADRALREYASFAAWSYAQHLALALDGVGREVLGAVNHGDNMHMSARVPDAHDVARYLRWDDACGCRHTNLGPSPDGFFALGLRSRSFTEDVNAASGAGPLDVYRSASDSGSQASGGPLARETTLRGWVFDSLTPRIRSRGGLNRGFRFVIERQTATPRIVAYTLMPLASGDTMVYGAVYSAQSFERVLAATLDSRDLLPSAFSEGRANRDVIALAVADRTNHRLFATGEPPASALSSHASTSVSSDSLMVDAAVRPEIAGTLLIGGLPPTGIPFPLGLLALAAALSVIAVVQIRREGELVRLRAGFVSSVSHELRTPVAQIRLYVETLRLGRTNTAAQREWALDHIDRESRRLAYLVENVLRFATLEGHQATVSEVIDPALEVAHIIAEFRPLAESRGVAIELEAGPTPLVFVPADALRHILVNLLDNAVKYGPPEQKVRVSVHADGPRVTIAVQDEGPGVSGREHEAIWRPFIRGSAAGASGGSGIGLTIVRELARAHGGMARAERGGERGTRFVVTLPAADPGETRARR